MNSITLKQVLEMVEINNKMVNRFRVINQLFESKEISIMDRIFRDEDRQYLSPNPAIIKKFNEVYTVQMMSSNIKQSEMMYSEDVVTFVIHGDGYVNDDHYICYPMKWFLVSDEELETELQVFFENLEDLYLKLQKEVEKYDNVDGSIGNLFVLCRDFLKKYSFKNESFIMQLGGYLLSDEVVDTSFYDYNDE